MESIDLTNKPVIFPRYTISLIANGDDIIIKGNKVADTELARIIYEVQFQHQALDVVPEILAYDTHNKIWSEVNPNGKPVQLIGPGKSATLVYYPLPEAQFDSGIRCAIKAFLSQFSAAQIALG